MVAVKKRNFERSFLHFACTFLIRSMLKRLEKCLYHTYCYRQMIEVNIAAALYAVKIIFIAIDEHARLT